MARKLCPGSHGFSVTVGGAAPKLLAAALARGHGAVAMGVDLNCRHFLVVYREDIGFLERDV